MARINGTLHKGQYTFFFNHTSPSSSKNEKIFQTKLAKKVKTHVLCSKSFLQKSYRLWNVEKSGTVGQTTNDNPRRSLQIRKVKNTQCMSYVKGKGKAVTLQAWTGPQGSRKLMFPDFVTTPKDVGRLSALRTGRLYPPGNIPGTHFC